MSDSKLANALKGITPTLQSTTDVAEINDLMTDRHEWFNSAAATGTNAIAEMVVGSAKRKCRVRRILLIPAAAVTANGTNYWTLIVRKRTAAVPGTQVTLCTFATDTPTTDDLVAWAQKNLASFLTATAADLELAKGDVITVEVTKTGGSGLSFPIANVEVELSPVSA